MAAHVKLTLHKVKSPNSGNIVKIQKVSATPAYNNPCFLLVVCSNPVTLVNFETWNFVFSYQDFRRPCAYPGHLYITAIIYIVYCVKCHQ